MGTGEYHILPKLKLTLILSASWMVQTGLCCSAGYGARTAASSSGGEAEFDAARPKTMFEDVPCSWNVDSGVG